jgi:osmotically-inducible protein OsmY
MLATLLVAAGYCPAALHPAEKAVEPLQEVVVSAVREKDEQITRQVQEKLTNDPWIFAEHITVTTENGVVRLEGIVGDTGELFRVIRLARRIPGARRVVTALEIMHNDPDGG